MKVVTTIHHNSIPAGTVMTDVVGDGPNFVGTVDGKDVSVPKYKCSFVGSEVKTEVKPAPVLEPKTSPPLERIKSGALDQALFEMKESNAKNEFLATSKDWMVAKQIGDFDNESPLVLDERTRTSYLT